MFNLAYMHENGLGLRKDMHLAKRFYDMASETSGEAAVPVALALFKLNLLFYFENLLKNNLNDLLFFPSHYFDNSISSNWDIYLMAILGGLISFIYLFRRRINEVIIN
jgi:SEL1 protein